MILRRVQVTHYKNIDDSEPVEIGQVTCLVGKNESGKTAFLQALNKLNPVEGQEGDYDPTMEYPRKRLNAYERDLERGGEVAPVVVATFELQDEDLDELPALFEGAVQSREVTVTKRHDNRTTWDFELDYAPIVARLVDEAELPAAKAKELVKSSTVMELRKALDNVEGELPQVAALIERIDHLGGSANTRFIKGLNEQMPQFFYFDDYSIMKGRISVPDLRRKVEANELDEADQTFLSFLEFIGADLDDFQTEDNFEHLVARLEAASNEISDELFKFWSQNDQLAVEFRLSGADQAAPPPFNEGTNLHIRIRNDRHRVTVPFDQRSRGLSGSSRSLSTSRSSGRRERRS